MDDIRVLIADDSRLSRALIREMLEQDPAISVVGEAEDGRQAVAMAAELAPQLITMDLEMPQMSGLEAIEEIMHSRAVPILVISGQADSTNAYEAVSRGALEVLAKHEVGPAAAEALVEKVKLLSGVRVITHLRSRGPKHRAPSAPARPVSTSANGIEVVAIAASTGGPQALSTLLPALPAELAAPVVIAQHIAEGFAADMAQWLDGLTSLRVRMGEEGALLEAGTVYLAPSESHLIVTPSRRLALPARDPSDIYKPSCDRLLASAAAVYGQSCLGLILTGMGRDGVEGMRAINDAGGPTFGQDEASSLIYGMNGLAAKAGVVERELPLEAMAEAIVERVGLRAPGGDAV